MSSKTRILILKKREIIYTGIFAVLGIILIILMILMFRPGGNTASSTTRQTYVPGVYSTAMTLNNAAMNLEVSVDENHINSIRLVNLSETVTTMLPLIEPTLDKISAQVCEKQSTKDIYYEDNARYTAQMLIGAIDQTLELAKK